MKASISFWPFLKGMTLAMTLAVTLAKPTTPDPAPAQTPCDFSQPCTEGDHQCCLRFLFNGGANSFCMDIKLNQNKNMSLYFGLNCGTLSNDFCDVDADCEEGEVCSTNPNVPKGSAWGRCQPTDVCDSGWLYQEGMCYQFQLFSRTKNVAEKRCRKKGAVLAMPKTKSQWEGIMDAHFAGMNQWLGMTDEAVEGEWRWDDGSLVTWANWNDGSVTIIHGKRKREARDRRSVEPNGGRRENCAMMYTTGYYNDVACDDGLSFPYTCQKIANI